MPPITARARRPPPPPAPADKAPSSAPSRKDGQDGRGQDGYGGEPQDREPPSPRLPQAVSAENQLRDRRRNRRLGKPPTKWSEAVRQGFAGEILGRIRGEGSGQRRCRA